MSDAFCESEEKFTFSDYDGLPREPDSLRISPNSGTNMSTVFGESSLAVLDMSEEQLEILSALRIVPQPLLSTYQHLDSAVEVLQHAKADLLRRSDTLGRAIDKLSTQQIRPLAQSKAKTLINLSIAERKAGKNLTLFSTHCRSVRNRFLSLSSNDRAEIEVFFNQIDTLLRRLQDVDAYTTASALFYESSVDSGAVTALGMIYSTLDAEAAVFEDDDIKLARSMSAHLREFYVLSQPLESGLTAGDESWFREHLAAPRNPEHAWKCVHQDLDIFRFLFGIDTTREIDETAMTELIYSYIKDRLVQHLCTTPAEFALSALLAEHISTISSCLLLGSLVNAYMWRFDNRKSHSAARLCYRISENFRVLSRVGHSLGAQPSESFKLLAQHCEQIMPYLSAPECIQPSTGQDRIDEATRNAQENASLRCWGYNDTRKPWLPKRHRRSLNLVSSFGIIRSDTILSSLRSSDLWMNLKWAGVDVDALTDENLSQLRQAIGNDDFGIGDAMESTVDNGLLRCLFQFAKQEPERNVTFIVALLGLSTREKPLFFNKEEEFDCFEVLTCEELVVTPPPEEDASSEEWPQL